jgi:bacteriocin biosynthesis cyclodehydratase domain-containing protein
MAQLPRLRPGVAVIAMEGGVQLRHGDEEVQVLRTDAADLVRALCERLDGRRDREAALSGLDPSAGPLLDELLGLLEEADWLGGPVFDFDAVLRAARVAVVGHDRTAERLVDVVAEHGMAVTLRPRGANALADTDVVVCASEAPDLALFFEVNDAACEARVPCLFVDLSHGLHATVGPFFVPGEGACARCFRARLRENTAAFDELVAAERQMLESGEPLPAYGCLPAHRALVAGVAAAELVAYFAKHRPLRTLNRAVTIALEHARMWTEPVWRVPWCPSCGRAKEH